MSTDTPTLTVTTDRCQDLLTQIVRIRSVVGEPTTAHLWVSERLRELGMTVEHYAVEGRTAPLVLGVLEGDGDEPGVLFDAHFDTVHARPEDWSRDPWGAQVEDGVLYGRGAVDSKGTHVSMLAALEAVVAVGASRRGPIYFMSDSDGEDGFRGAALMADLGVAQRIDTVFSAEATSNRGIEIAYPGISTWKVTAIGRTAHPTEPENGINAITKMAKLVDAVNAGRLETPRGSSDWFEPRVTLQAIRTLPGGGWTIPGRCDAVVSVMSPAGATLNEVRDSIDAFLRMLEREDGEVRFEFKVLPMGGGRLWLRPGESDPNHRGVRAIDEAISAVRGAPGEVRKFNGGWVDAVELMRTGPDGYGSPAVITFGPGDFDQAHAVDEHIAISEVRDAAEIYARTTLALLG
ncbi:M20 family metallopeptidase [Capillimicrobium parvum]|uniref:Acetylornithine deacetylase n=1 Tax=Capillimicrobium parvum TaxID=2884022 RepID=A0A9E7C0H7_9ACTN|nr:M20/M25/M40 family metallo-hydrolase [Capillimicrobium parvum]UGS35547.1 Acetylornithine deacetylase [Capillimicrobium parvum]